MSSVGNDNSLAGIRAIIVEDEGAIALLIEDMLFDFGCEVCGTAARISKAITLLAETEIDVAILDLNIAGEPVYPLVDELKRRNIPYLISTGYGKAGLEPAYQDSPVLPKPFTQKDLEVLLKSILATPAP
ncbi:response regulator [Microvirga sp. W0021]|uniref:Response regulator n=1 Tax=Hohaiivirga grylli TaxID=3133970 RepID=A0ABV0BLF5_9HYPH